MASTDLSGRLFQKYMMEMVKDVVWKDGYSATLAERECDIIYTDKYTSAARKLLEYYSVSQLKMITDLDITQFNEFINSQSTPGWAVEYLRIFWDYEEPNSYYRMLYGKPPLNCDPKYGVYPKVDNPWGLDPDKPIHDAPQNILYIFENNGDLEYYKGLIETDKTFLYVNHMTDKKIYPFIARLAQRFDLLYVPTTEIANLSKDFREVYQLCRDFIVLRYYSDAYRSKYEYYEGMMGMSILFQAVQQMHVKYLDADITRDFYDLDSIRIIYDAYSVPFYENIPTVYHQKIVKLMNRLIRYKGGNQVFFDLCALFDYESLDVFKYYLVREQRFNETTGKPVFALTANGQIDYQKTYRLLFAKGLINGDPFIDITDPNNHLDYFPVTSADPYWYNDAELLQKVYQTEYNYTETKYIGLQMVFSLTKFMLESAYFMQMIAQNRFAVSNIRVSHGKLGSDIDLFTLIVYIHAIIYYRLGYEGNIPETLEGRAIIMGFNFKTEMDLIIQDVRNQSSRIPSEDLASIIDILQRMKISDLSSCATVYENIKQLYNIIDAGILSCHDPDTYFAYKHLYMLLLTTEQTADIYRKSDGTIANSITELLEDLNPILWIRIQSLSDNALVQELQYSLVALEKAGSDMKYIQNYGGIHGKIISEYLYTLIRVFKSAKVDLVDFKAIYVVDGRCTNLVKLMVKLRLLSMTKDIDDDYWKLDDDMRIRWLHGVFKSAVPLYDETILMLMLHYINDDSFALAFKDIIVKGEIEHSGTIADDTLPIIDDIADFLLKTTINEHTGIFTDKLIRLE